MKKKTTLTALVLGTMTVPSVFAYDPDHKLDIMTGLGHYRGNTAVALGACLQT